MANKAVVVIINDGKVLMVEGVNQYGRRDHFFISVEIKDQEKEEDAIIAQLQRLKLQADKVLKASQKTSNGDLLFLVNLENQNISLEDHIKDIPCLSKDFRVIEVKWVSLKDLRAFNPFNTQCLKLIYKEAIMANYQGEWLEAIQKTFFIGPIGEDHLKKIHREKERSIVDKGESIRGKMMAMLMALGLGIVFNYFFIWEAIGISSFIFTSAVILVTLNRIGWGMALNKKLSLIFLIPIVLLSLSFSIFNDFVLRGINLLVIPFLVVCYLLCVRYEDINTINTSLIFSGLDRILHKGFATATRYFKFGKEVIEDKRAIKTNPMRNNILKGVIISIPLLIVVILLLSSADAMFKYHIQSIGEVFNQFRIDYLIRDMIVITAVTLYLFGFIWSFKYPSNQVQRTPLLKPSWEPITIITIVFIINVAYLLFTIVQFSYLYGGGGLPEGFTYAEYARRGFFELILVTIINLIILIFSTNLTKTGGEGVNKFLKGSYCLLIAFTFNMLISANYKMHLYEKAYGFTRLRIYVRTFMVLIGVSLLIILLAVWIKKIPVFKNVFIASLAIYMALNFMNVDGIIARENIQRYIETNKLDFNYLSSLSYDAIPEITKLINVEDEDLRARVKNHLTYEKKKLMEDYDRWFEYNYYKNKLLKLNLEDLEK
ncbi:DUF4153 domain-containing protein [Alkaliphilus serpentinus]|uniref:DUF4173 domain-containing protein n=1 Tax=Alkaliphilus serpentinus TaxID=1482731 RepID=A0A833MA34_9FIRM|nr:DUF4173 domain-containing protein [Alkaliphilus serpentinus]KAB3530013.1 DUF4173 domain-containing protein [Alkaliphilus serpentinus]